MTITKKKDKKQTKSKKSLKSPGSKTNNKTKEITAKKSKKPKKTIEESLADSGIIIVDDELSIDKEKVNEERKAFLEEARSQEAFD